MTRQLLLENAVCVILHVHSGVWASRVTYRSFKRSFSPASCVGSCITVKKLESAGPQVHHDERIKQRSTSRRSRLVH